MSATGLYVLASSTTGIKVDCHYLWVVLPTEKTQSKTEIRQLLEQACSEDVTRYYSSEEREDPGSVSKGPGVEGRQVCIW